MEKKDRYKSSSFKTYNYKVPGKYDSNIWMKMFKATDWDASIVTDIRDNMANWHILDIGCATGRLLETLAQNGAKNLYGTDIAPNIIDIAQKRLNGYTINKKLQASDAETQIPWEDECFDVVTMTGFSSLLSPS